MPEAVSSLLEAGASVWMITGKGGKGVLGIVIKNLQVPALTGISPAETHE